MSPTLSPRRVVTVEDEALAQRCAQGRIVLIDDHPEVLRSLRTLLWMEGYACDEYPSAVDYLQWRERQEPVFPGPVCVLSDVRMPDMDGLGLLMLMQQHADTPLILMSGASGMRDAIQGFRLGAVDFLLKPVETSELLGAIARALALSTERQRHRDRDGDLAARLASLSPREHSVAERIVQGQTNQQIADALGISLRSVKRVRQAASQKLGANSTAELVLRFTGSAATGRLVEPSRSWPDRGLGPAVPTR